jgi:hypothetical protein
LSRCKPEANHCIRFSEFVSGFTFSGTLSIVRPPVALPSSSYLRRDLAVCRSYRQPECALAPRRTHENMDSLFHVEFD